MKRLLFIGLVLCLGGCSKVSTDIQNSLGVSVEAYYSKKTETVCFTTSSGHQDNIYCIPANSVNTQGLEPQTWTVV